jgi:Sec7-like guanine-nucleotide exchange factor
MMIAVNCSVLLTLFFVLYFSALMFHTGEHYSNLKSRLILDQFIQNNSCIGKVGDLSDEFLTDLYQGICSKRIFLTDQKVLHSELLTPEQKAELYQSDTTAALEEAKQRTLAASHQWQTSTLLILSVHCWLEYGEISSLLLQLLFKRETISNVMICS